MAITPEWMIEAAETVLEERADTGITSYPMYVNEQGVATETLFFDNNPGEHTYYVVNDGERIDVPGVTTVLKGAIDKSFALIPWATKLAVETIRARIFAADGSLVEISTEEWNALLVEAKNKHREKLEDAGNIGNIVHSALELAIKEAIKDTDGYIRSARFAPTLPNGYVQGTDLAFELRTSMARSCFLAALEWCRRHQVEFLHTERKIYSRSYFFAGTTDGIANVTICDDPECCGGLDDIGSRVQGIIDWKSSAALRDEYALQAAAYQFAAIEELNLPLTHRFINRLGKENGEFESWVCRPSLFTDDLDTFLSCLRLYNSHEKLKARRSAEKAAVKAVIKGQKAAQKAEKVELDRQARLAASDAKKAIREADKAERESVKAEAKLAKQAAKPSLALVKAEPVLVKPDSHLYSYHDDKARQDGQHNALAELSAYDQEIGIDAQPSAAELAQGFAIEMIQTLQTNVAEQKANAAKRGFDESFWEGGFSVGADGKVADIKASAELAKPGIAHTMHGNAEPRATRFWTTSMTYTIQGRIQ
jgi:hypothetical protein